MKIVDSADWRDGLAYETPYRVEDVLPGDPARCAGCSADTEPWDRAALWAVKHRHPKNHSGFVRFYCAEHLPPRPVVKTVEPVKPVRRRAAAPASRAPRATAPSTSTDVVRAMCPNCFIEVSATGTCGVCGEQV